VAFDAGNYPNPFNGATTIHYSLPEPATVRLTVYDILGREVRVLVAATQPAGEHAARWDGRDATDRPVSTGLYLYRLHAGTYHAVGRMLLTK
jgi:flagellar hook assembly protein FlgD